MSSLGMMRLALVPMVALVGAASGQVAPVAPYFAVVSADDAMMRCGSEDNFYPVAKLARGQLVRVDGEGGGWSRVGYPAGTPAFIPADSFKPDATGKTGTVTKASKLKALNMTTGLKGSWAPVLETPVAVGTKLAILDTEATPDGRGSTAFKVTPPENARAFVQATALRKATNDEINAAMATKASEPTRPETAPGSKPVVTAPGNQPALRPVNPTTTAQGPNSKPAPAPLDPAPVTTVEVKPAQPLAASPYEKLEATFEEVKKQPPETAEFGPLMSEIQAEMDKLDDSTSSNMIRRRLDQRLEYLQLSMDIQARKRKLAETQAGWSEHDKVIKARMEDVAKARQYTLVGRLSASTIYDGKRMPLMYRVQTVGGPAPRTLAYLKPDTKLGIDSKLGEVVGVLGTAVMDPTLRINIITPLRVDTLEPAETPKATSPSTEPVKPAADASDGGK